MTDTTAPRTAAGRSLLDLVYTLVGRHLAADAPADWRERITPEWTTRILAIEAEAIEPLLALVRAAEELREAQSVETTSSSFDAVRIYDAVAGIYAELDRLPESVRVAARKPE